MRVRGTARRRRPCGGHVDAQTRLVDGGTEDLIGVSLLRFDADGLVIEQRDIWVGRLKSVSPLHERLSD